MQKMESKESCYLFAKDGFTATSRNSAPRNNQNRKSYNIPIFAVLLLILLINHAVVCVQGLSSRQPSTVVRGRNIIHGNDKVALATTGTSSSLNLRRNKNSSSFDQLGRDENLSPSVDITTSSHFMKSHTSLHATKPNDDERAALSRTDSSRGTLLSVFLTFFLSTIALAKMDIIGPYTNELIFRDSGAALLSSVLALIFVKTITMLAAKNILQPRDSRKIIHTLSAPLFMLVWPLFSDLWGARLFAASVPLLQAVRLWLAGMNQGGADSNELAGAISRSGDEKEALGGPFIYVVILFSAIILCFRDNYAAVMALSAMAAGDGMADIIGRRFGKGNKWFFNKDKSVAGTFAFIAASSVCSIGIGLFLQYVGAITVALPFAELVGKFVTISALSAFIELVPTADDNWSVPIGAGILSLLLLK